MQMHSGPFPILTPTPDLSVKEEDRPSPLRLPEPNSCLYTLHITVLILFLFNFPVVSFDLLAGDY